MRGRGYFPPNHPDCRGPVQLSWRFRTSTFPSGVSRVHSHFPGGGQGVLQAAALGLRGAHDPARKTLLKSITRYAEELWLVSDPGLWRSRHLRPGELLQGVESVAKKNKMRDRFWRRGPFSGFLAALRQVDWQYLNPTTLLDNHGRKLNLAEGEPKLLQKKAGGDHRRAT